jgi:hypothetical protein
VLLQRSLDLSLLREKELLQEQAMAQHRLQEMEASRLWRENPPPPELPPSPGSPEPLTELDRLLGRGSESSTPRP